MRVLHPAQTALEVDGAELPLLERVLDACLEPLLLLLVADAEPVLDEDETAADEHALELGAGTEEVPHLVLRAVAHDALDAGAVVPGAIEEDHLAGGRQMSDVALEVPLRLLAIARLGERRDAHHARVEVLGHALDGAALAGRVTALEDHRDAQARVPDPLLQLDELDLQPVQLVLVHMKVELLA